MLGVRRRLLPAEGGAPAVLIPASGASSAAGSPLGRGVPVDAIPRVESRSVGGSRSTISTTGGTRTSPVSRDLDRLQGSNPVHELESGAHHGRLIPWSRMPPAPRTHDRRAGRRVPAFGAPSTSRSITSPRTISRLGYPGRVRGRLPARRRRLPRTWRGERRVRLDDDGLDVRSSLGQSIADYYPGNDYVHSWAATATTSIRVWRAPTGIPSGRCSSPPRTSRCATASRGWPWSRGTGSPAVPGAGPVVCRRHSVITPGRAQGSVYFDEIKDGYNGDDL